MKSVLKSYIRLKTKPLSEETKNKQEGQLPETKQPENTLPKHDFSKSSLNGGKTSLGDYLQEARVNLGQTIHQVSQITKIHTHYLEALEREDFANTPPSIYVKAYIKRVCDLYKIDSVSAIAMYDAQIGEGDTEDKIPKDLVKNLEETKLPNTQQEEKIRQYMKFGIAGATSLILVIIIITIILSFSGKNKIEDKPLTADEKAQLTTNMEKILSAQPLEAVAIKIDTKN
ncbi:MAG TPA: hypothetical protein DD381_09030 [Lentisphaeria bacterium]|nr:MAG: hypothetical protein A2X47_07830 [Lentisphaerae bacterium GWF2_38_69]HBM16465.1 hypothetical protein [Lentisphaeria bacterium]